MAIITLSEMVPGFLSDVENYYSNSKSVTTEDTLDNP